MNCQKCGAELPNDVRFCTSCGSAVEQPMNGTQPQFNQGQPAFNGQPQFNQGQPNLGGQPYGTPNMTKAEFEKHANMKPVMGNIKGSAIIMYICAAINLITCIDDILFGLFIAFAFVALGLGIQIAKSRVCAIIVLVYSIINTLAYLILYQQKAGWLIILAGVYATMATFQYHKAWKAYQETGVLPEPNAKKKK